jgi:DNA-binding LytR/AlgR family response regulator
MIAMCDDERAQLYKLERAVLRCAVPGWRPKTAARFSSGEALLRAVKDGASFDFIFLDIQMPGLDGVETYKKLPESMKQKVLFVSTHAEAMPDVFDLTGPLFLFKPYNQKTFDNTIRSVFKRMDEYIFRVDEDGELREFPCSGIRYIKSNGHYLDIFADKREGFFRAKLDEVEKELVPHGFFRCHRSYLINLRFFIKRDAKRAYLKGAGADDIEIPLGKAKIRALDDAFIKYKTEKSGWV